MFWDTRLRISKTDMMISGRAFTLGALTTDFLNADWDFDALFKLNDTFQKELQKQKSHPSNDEWYLLNTIFGRLDSKLKKSKLFSLLRDDWFRLYQETADMTATLKFGAGENANVTTQFYMSICPGELSAKWQYYIEWMDRYAKYIDDTFAFCTVAKHIFEHHINTLPDLKKSSYLNAFGEFVNGDLKFTLDMPYREGHAFDLFLEERPVGISQTVSNNKKGVPELIDIFTVTDILTVLKLDFVKSIGAGYVIRKCHHCGRYFLLTRLYRTIYCDGRSPENKQFSCQQMGRQTKKELAENFPYSRAKKNALNLAAKHLERDKITQNEYEKLNTAIKDLHHFAVQNGMSYLKFEQILRPQELYPKCGVAVKSKPRGRPRGERHD